MKKVRNDLTGKEYGRLFVLGVDDSGGRKTKYLCRCECGNIKSIRADALVCGRTKSCGCLKKEQDLINLKDNKTHNMSGTRIYKEWQGMKNRCYNTHSARYKDYGGRGVSVCDEWINDFECFYKWAINNGYDDDLTIDRIDNDGNYSPKNCRWTNDETQARNRRTNVNITIGNVTKTLIEWCEIFDLPYSTINARYHRNINATIDELFRSERG